MKRLLLAGILLLLAAPAHAADTLPDAMMGSWGMGDEEGIMDRAGPDSGDFEVKKDYHYAVDTACKILHVERLTKGSYIVQASCYYEGDDPPSVWPITDTSEFELKGDRLRVTTSNRFVMSTKERAHFRLIQAPCGNVLLCRVYPRFAKLVRDGTGAFKFLVFGDNFRYSVVTIALASAASNSSYNAIATGLLRKRLA